MNYGIMVFMLMICDAGTPVCDAIHAKQTFTAQMSTKSCPIYREMYGKAWQYDANYARNKFGYAAAPGDVFVAVCGSAL